MNEQRKNDFLNQLNVSQRTKTNYVNAIKSAFMKSNLIEFCDTENLFDITDIKQLWIVYSHINLHPTNVANHRAFSAAIMKYIRFLNNGNKYGRRIDYLRKRA